MTATERFDVAVLGGGPGGYATALRAAGHGLSVAIVEEGDVGGTCLHRGCIPSKALLHIAALADAVPELTALGLVDAGDRVLDLAAAGALRDGVVTKLHRGLVGLIDARGITTIRGRGKVETPGSILVTDADGAPTIVTATHIVVATGSTPIDLPMTPRDGRQILNSDDALRLERIPSSAVIVGAGAIGVEFASLWRSLGATVTLVELEDEVVPNEDPDVGRTLRRAFERRGIDCLTGTGIESAQRTDAGVDLELSAGLDLHVAQVLVAVGRKPSTRDIGLEQLGVLGPRGEVVADEMGQTSVNGLWAVGDVLPTVALAHAAFAEGFVVADAIAGHDVSPVDHALVPRVTYCRPEIGSVGLTEPEARETHDGVRVETASLAGNARSIIESTPGLVKLISAADGTLLGGHVVGPSATELIAELGLALSWEALDRELADVTHAHPTVGESIREAALASAGMPFHVHS